VSKALDLSKQAPINRRQVSLWLEAFAGFKPHSTIRCTDPDCTHHSQLDYITAAYFNEYRNAVLLAARGAGKSYCCAAVTLLDCWHKPGIEIAICAFKRDQSDYIYLHLCKFLKYFEGVLGQRLWTITKNEIAFHNGSRVLFFSGGSSKSNVKGCHPSILIVDEADDWKLDRYDGVANCLDNTGKYPQRFDTLSTNYSLSGEGVVLKAIERAEEFNKVRPESLLPHKVFRICFLDILQKCDDRYQCSTCPLFKYCHGKAKQGDGFISIADAMQTMFSSSRGSFESQMLLLRPTSELTYFTGFDPFKNVLEGEAQAKYDPHLSTYLMIDFGGSRCPHAALLMQQNFLGIYYVIKEWQQMGHLENLVSDIKSDFPQLIHSPPRVFCDNNGSKTDNVRGAKSPIQVLREAGWHPRHTSAIKRRPTFEAIANLIEPASGSPKMLINRCCKTLITQIENAECERDRRGKPTADPLDAGNDDLLDCLRYGVYWTALKPGRGRKAPAFF
jgi:hypothetical protein